LFASFFGVAGAVCGFGNTFLFIFRCFLIVTSVIKVPIIVEVSAESTIVTINLLELRT
jgi:hypothetical protein